MRVVYREQDSRTKGQIPDFLQSEFVNGTWEPTGFDVDFPAMSKDPVVIAAMGFTGKSFLENRISIARWYNRDTGIMVGSVMFSEECEGPAGLAHGGAVASALDDIMGTMVWREMGFWTAGIPTVQLNVRLRWATPMGRQLRFDTYIAEREGRKVTAKVVLRDPTSGQVLAEGEGLFYARKPQRPQPSLEPPSPAHRAASSPSPDGLRGKAVGGRPAAAAAAASAGPLAPPPPSLPPPLPPLKLPQTRPGGREGRRLKTKPLRQAGTKSYDDALRDFGRGNPNAVANLLDFHRGGSGSSSSDSSGGSGSGNSSSDSSGGSGSGSSSSGSSGGGSSSSGGGGGGGNGSSVFRRSKL